ASELYRRQVGLMTYDQYLEFIEPYLTQAEATLQVPKYLMTTAGLDPMLCQRYFKSLADHNVAIFRNQLQAGVALIATGKQLREAIAQIKAAGALTNLDVVTEFQKTDALLKNANRAFYQQLGTVKKAKLLLSSWL
ncbi:MAG TPA: hypothetical protein VJJ83_00540, partial [Candidatus Babeliales bacterium]|nr:hypothetical protein [Candidatus Babeliales bacterium]